MDEYGFTQFWIAYPRKVAKGAARKAFDAALKKTPLDVMLAALAWQTKQSAWREVKFIPHPATWLRAERWDDEPPRQPLSAQERWQIEKAQRVAVGPDRHPR